MGVTAMGLTWRDGAETALAGLVVAIALAVTDEWGWPLLGGARAGVVALAIVGNVMCLVAQTPSVVEAWIASPRKDPAIAIASALGALALGLVIAGLIVGTESVLLALAFTLVTLWAVTTVIHAVEGPSIHPAAGA
jgi:hypothetical protein